MKKQLLYTLSFAMAFTACKKSFLDKTPESNLSTGSFYASATDAEEGLTGAYRTMANGNFFQYDNLMNTDGRSDNCYVNGDNTSAEQPLEMFTYVATNTNIQRDWQELYNNIRSVNAVLDAVPGLNSDEWAGTTRKSQILGEARFLRAMNYYWLVTEWGDVPLITSEDNGGDYYPTRAASTEVYAQIITDLVYADSTLNTSPYNGQYGRATKGAADAMLAKTYAQMGDYTNSLVYANKVISSGTYALVGNYANLWGAANKNNSEAILEIQYSGSTYSFWGVEMFAYVASDQWAKRNIGSYDLIQAFKAAGDTTGARYKATFNWQVANASFNSPAAAWEYTEAIPFMNKWPDPSGWNSTDNITLIRLGDIILLAAEANNELGNTATAVTLLDQIRTRAGLANTTATTKTDLATAILNERRLELVNEGTRWNDLLRAEKNGYVNVVNLMNSQKDESGATINYGVNTDKHQYLFPIPEQDRLLNKNLTQNTGY